ncbi:MAG TPA: hypothetical protein ENJ87_01090 [Gammaproteobacteria bacterium]|nr:hypothetical protein [Gammaproteobacteria bacterium]
MKNIIYSSIIYCLFSSVLTVSVSYAGPENQQQYPEREYLEEPDYLPPVKPVKKVGKDIFSDADQTFSENKTYDELVSIIEASIKLCHDDLAQRHIKMLKAVADTKSAEKVEQLNGLLKTRLIGALQHKNNLNKLAIVIQEGDIRSIKVAIRAAIETASCPGDRDQLIKVVKSIKVALKREAEEKQRVMNAAISKGQAVQNREMHQRRMIAKSLLLLVGVLDLDSSASSLPTINQFQLTDELTAMSLEGVQKILETRYSATEVPGTNCVVEDMNEELSQQGSIYYVLTSIDEDAISRYRIKAVASDASAPDGLVLGPYDTYATAKMITGVVCPIAQ